MTSEDSPLSVLYVTRNWPPAVGGMETYSRELTRELDDLVSLRIRALPGRKDGRGPSPLSLLTFLISTAAFLARKKSEFDIVHFGDFVLFPLAWWHSKWHPKGTRVISVHGLDLTYGRKDGVLPSIYRWFVRWARRRSDRVACYIANSRNTSSIAHELGFGPTAVVPLAVRSPERGDQTPRSQSSTYLLFVGRIVARKGLSWFVREVLPLLPQDLTLRVVGKALDVKERAAIEDDPRVEILGYVEEARLARLRLEATAIIMPNVPVPNAADVEGFGLVAVEAAAIGTPIVASNIEGITDAIRNEETGFLVPPLNPEAWAERIIKILNWSADTRAQFSAKAQEVAASYYSWRRVADDVVSAYETSGKRRLDSPFRQAG